MSASVLPLREADIWLPLNANSACCQRPTDNGTAPEANVRVAALYAELESCHFPPGSMRNTYPLGQGALPSLKTSALSIRPINVMGPSPLSRVSTAIR